MRPLSFVIEACGGRLLRGRADAPVRGVSTDTRELESGQLFVALEGDRFDGHKFLARAAAQGAAAAVVQRGKPVPDDLALALVEVASTRAALGSLAARYRSEFDPLMTAVAGSNGKTTTKGLVASVFSQRWRTLASPRSYNNEVGVPLTLLCLERDHQAAVIEAGTNHPGELAPLLQWIRPSVGVLTSLGREHLEFFGDFNGVLEEEGWLAQSLPADGLLVMDGDSPGADQVRRRSAARAVRVGWGEGNEWRAHAARMDETGVSFQVQAPRQEFSGEYRVNLVGRHQVTNALLAVAVGAELGLEPERIRQGLTDSRPPRQRMQVTRSGGICVIDDAYNANPESMRAALEALMELPCRGRRIAVFGEMAELGGASESAHRELGRRAAEAGVDGLFVTGRGAPWMEAGAREAGLDWLESAGDAGELAAKLAAQVGSGDVVLVKGSRAARMERVSEALLGAPDRGSRR